MASSDHYRLTTAERLSSPRTSSHNIDTAKVSTATDAIGRRRSDGDDSGYESGELSPSPPNLPLSPSRSLRGSISNKNNNENNFGGSFSHRNDSINEDRRNPDRRGEPMSCSASDNNDRGRMQSRYIESGRNSLEHGNSGGRGSGDHRGRDDFNNELGRGAVRGHGRFENNGRGSGRGRGARGFGRFQDGRGERNHCGRGERRDYSFREFDNDNDRKGSLCIKRDSSFRGLDTRDRRDSSFRGIADNGTMRDNTNTDTRDRDTQRDRFRDFARDGDVPRRDRDEVQREFKRDEVKREFKRDEVQREFNRDEIQREFKRDEVEREFKRDEVRDIAREFPGKDYVRRDYTSRDGPGNRDFQRDPPLFVPRDLARDDPRDQQLPLRGAVREGRENYDRNSLSGRSLLGSSTYTSILNETNSRKEEALELALDDKFGKRRREDNDFRRIEQDDKRSRTNDYGARGNDISRPMPTDNGNYDNNRKFVPRASERGIDILHFKDRELGNYRRENSAINTDKISQPPDNSIHQQRSEKPSDNSRHHLRLEQQADVRLEDKHCSRDDFQKNNIANISTSHSRQLPPQRTTVNEDGKFPTEEDPRLQKNYGRSPILPPSGNYSTTRDGETHQENVRGRVFHSAALSSFPDRSSFSFSDNRDRGSSSDNRHWDSRGSGRGRGHVYGGRGRGRADFGGRFGQRGRGRSFPSFHLEDRGNRDSHFTFPHNLYNDRNAGSSTFSSPPSNSRSGSRSNIIDGQAKNNASNSHLTDSEVGLIKSETKIIQAITATPTDIKKGDDSDKKPQPIKVKPPPKGKPTGIMIALTRLIELEASMEYAYAKHVLLVNRQKELEHQKKILQKLPVGLNAIKDDLEDKVRAAGDLYD